MPQNNLILSEEHRAKLDNIVSQMQSNGESDNDIQFVVDDFKSKYGTSPKQPTSSQGAESGFQGNAPLAKPNGLSDFTVKPISTPTSPSVSTSSVGEKKITPKQDLALKSLAFNKKEAIRKAQEAPHEEVPLDADQRYEHINLLEQRKNAVNSLYSATEKVAQNQYKEVQDLSNQLNDASAKIDELVKSGNRQAAIELQAQVKPLLDEYNSKSYQLKKSGYKLESLKNRLAETDKQMIDISEGQGGVTNQWQALNAGINQLTASILRTPQTVYNTILAGQNKLAEATGLPISAPYQTEGYLESAAKYFDKNADAYHKVIEKKKTQDNYDIISLAKNGDYAKAINLLGENIVESAPVTGGLAMASATGVGAVPLFLGGTSVFAAQNFQENKDKGISVEKNLLNSWTNATLEQIFEETGTLAIVRYGKDLFTKAGKEGVEEAAKTVWDKAYGYALKKLFPIGAAGAEGLSEAETTFTQNYVNTIMGMNDEFNTKQKQIENSNLSEAEKEDAQQELYKETLFKGVPDAFITGAGMGAVLGAGTKEGYTAIDDKKREELKQAQKKYDNLATTLSDPTIPKEAKDVIQQQVDLEAEKMQKIAEEDDLEHAEKLTPKEYTNVISVQAEIDKLENSLQSVTNPDAKAVVEAKIDDLVAKKHSILGIQKPIKYTSSTNDRYGYVNENGVKRDLTKDEFENYESKVNMEQQVEAAPTEESKGVGENTQAFTTDEKGKSEPIENVEDKIAVGGLKEGYTTSTETRLNADKNSAQYKENFDPRTSEGENSGNSFISTIERNGKKYRIVGLRMSNPKTIINGKPDRSGMSYASIVDDGNLPSNIDDLLIKKAIGEGKKLYSDVVELEDSDFIMPSEYKPTPIEESPVDLEKNKTSEKTENKEAVVPVKLFKQGDGGTRGVFEDKDGKLYKSIEPQEIVMTNNGIIRQPIKDVVTDEHKILSDLQNNPHIPKIGKIVNTSEGRAFEIEKLDEVDNFTKNEYRQIQKILNDLNDKGYHVGDRVTVMKRPKTGELVIVDFSAGYKGSRMSRDAEDYMQNVFDKLSKSDAIHIKQEDLAAHNRYMAENLMKKESTTEYYLTQRPPSIGTHPTEGLKSIEETEYRGRKVWKLTYDKKLSADQIYKFELTPKITNKEYLGQKISGIYGENLFYITDIDYKQGKVTLVSELNGKEISKDLSFKEFQKGIDDGKYKVQKSNEEAVVPSKEGSMGEATSEGEQPQAEVVEPTEGSRVELPNDFKNGLPKKMVFSQGEWKQEIGNELGKVGKKQQEEANNKFNQLNTKENATKEVSEQASVQGERKEGDASGETTKASGSNSVQREETSKQKEVKPKTTKKDVKISPRQKRINTLVDRINYYNNVLGKGKGNGYKKGRETVEGRELLNEINGIVRELGLHLDIQTNGIVVKYKKGGSKIRATYGGNKVGVENHVGLEQRRKSTQELFHTLNNAGQISFPIIRGLDGRKFTPKQIAEAISDVVNGHNSILADSLLNTLDRAIEEDFFETESYGREGNFIPLRDVMKYFGSQEGGMDYFTEDIDSEQEIKLAEEYDEWFNGLSEQEKEQELKYLQDEGTTDTETESESDVANQASKRVKETTSETSRKEKIAEAKKDFDAKQRAYEKAKVELEKRGMQDQVDIFGATKGEEMLFKNDLSEQRKIVDGLKKEAEKAKDVLSKLESEQEVGENQLTIEEPTKAEVSKENTEVQSNKESAQWDKDVESTAKALEGVGNGTVENSSELNSLIDKIESNIPYTIRKTFNKDSELISISDNTGTYSPKSKRGKELMGMIIDRLTGNSPKKMLYRGISSGEAYSEFHLRDKTRSQYISEAYHKAKADGNNPELVKAVEDLLGSTQSGIKAERKVESAPEKVQKEVKVDLKKIQEVADDMYALRKEPLTAKEKSEVKAKIAEQPLEVRESIAKAKKLMDKLEKQGLIRTIECK